MNQISKTHPALERIKGVKKYCGDKFMEFTWSCFNFSRKEVGGKKLLPMKTSITETLPLEEKNPCADWPQDKMKTSPSIQHYPGLNEQLVVSFQRITS